MKFFIVALSFVLLLSGCSLSESKELKSELLEEVVEGKPEVVEEVREIKKMKKPEEIENYDEDFVSLAPEKPACPDNINFQFTVDSLSGITDWAFLEYRKGDVVLSRDDDFDMGGYLAFVLANTDDYRVNYLDHPFREDENKITINGQVGRYYIDGDKMKITDLKPELETGFAKKIVENLLEVEKFRLVDGFHCGYLALEFPGGELKFKATQ